MQVAVARRLAVQPDRQEYSLGQRATLLCGANFPAHLAAWREALRAQRRDGAVPVTYVAAMCKVVATEAAAGGLDGDDALAAAVAIAELANADALQGACQLLRDLGAAGTRHAELLRLGLCVAAGPRAALAAARVDLLSMSGIGSVNERSTVTCLLGELYLARANSTADQAIAYRYFMAAVDEPCPAAAVAHFYLGRWYAKAGTQGDLLLASDHFERGAEHGCVECLRALSALHQDSDSHFAEELLELAELTTGAFRRQRSMSC